jgi:SAM-dependent methyltransferase
MRLYDELAPWFHLLTHPKDYEDEAKFYGDELERAFSAGPAGPRGPRRVLELGSGGGNNASHMKSRYDELVLTDLSPGMLELSKTLNPECEHVQGDMRSLRLGRTFDAVLIHDAIEYMTSEADLRDAFETAWVHLQPGGVMLVAPDCVRETFSEQTGSGGHDGDGRSLRYLSWDWDPDPDDCTYQTTFVYLLREGGGPPRVEIDQHEHGLHPQATWVSLLEQVGFRVEVRHTPDWDEKHPSQVIFVGFRPSE